MLGVMMFGTSFSGSMLARSRVRARRLVLRVARRFCNTGVDCETEQKNERAKNLRLGHRQPIS
jgi:hypothetical protein